MTHFCVSVDVEEDLPGTLAHSEQGIDEGLPALLHLLAEVQIRADFFFLSSVVQDHPDLVRDVIRGGHGIGNHGFDHSLLCRKSIEQQRKEIESSTRILQDATGSSPVIFRAPNFSVDESTLGLLAEAGYLVDSSILPGRFLRRFFRTIYDHRAAPQRPYQIRFQRTDEQSSLLEVPVTPNPQRPGAPLGQGALNAYGPRRLLELGRALSPEVFVYLVHPWELVDIGSSHPDLPPGYANVCSSDLGRLREFLSEVSKTFAITTLADYLRLERGEIA